MIRRIARYSFLQACAQGLLFISALLVASLAGPAQFGKYSTFLSSAAILSAVVTLRYDVVIAGSRSAAEAYVHARKFLVLLCAELALGIGAACCLREFIPFAASLPIVYSAAGASVLAVLGSVHLNMSRALYSVLPRILFAGTLFPFQWIFLRTAPMGALVYGHVASLTFAVLVAIFLHRKMRPQIAGEVPSDAKDLSKAYTISGILNAVCNNAPVQLVSLVHGDVLAGYYGLMDRVLGAPLLLLGNSISSALIPEIARKQGKFVRIHKWFTVLATLFLIAGYLIFKSAYLDISDGRWADARWMFLAFLPVFAIRIAAIPGVSVIGAARDGAFMMAWEMLRLVFLVGLLLASRSIAATTWLYILAFGWAGMYFMLYARGLYLSYLETSVDPCFRKIPNSR